MKYLLFICLSISLNLHSQTYSFSHRNGTYSNLTDSISLNRGLTWDYLTYRVPIGFNFKFYDTTINELFFDESFYDGGGVIRIDTNALTVTPIISVFGVDLIDLAADTTSPLGLPGSLSPVSYKVTGNVGSRIFKLEWRNVGFFYELIDNNISTDYANFQLWLYEGSNDIEFHYGPNSITQPIISYNYEDGVYVGLWEGYSGAGDSLIGERIQVKGSPITPLSLYTESNFDIDSVDYLIGSISDGMIMKFSRNNNSAVETINKEKIDVYPNPVSDRLYIKFLDANQKGIKLQVLDIGGKIIMESTTDVSFIDVQPLQSGIYFLRYIDLEGARVKKFIKN